MIRIMTPFGVKTIRDSQLSVDGRFIKVIDKLNQARWCAIDALYKTETGYAVPFGEDMVQLKPTVFLEETA